MGNELTEEFVLRPGRTAVVWSEKARRVSVKVQADVAVTVSLEDSKGVLGLSPQRLEHELQIDLTTVTRVKLMMRNISGTRKARGTFEIVAS